VNRPYLILFALGLLIFDLSGCTAISRHQFAEPAVNWQARNGQLLYRNARRTLIGEVLVRFSNRNNFELTFSKGVTLLTLREDANFAEVRGALAGRGWSGPIDSAPPPLRGWLQLRDKIVGGQNQQSIRYTTGGETFLFHF